MDQNNQPPNNLPVPLDLLALRGTIRGPRNGNTLQHAQRLQQEQERLNRNVFRQEQLRQEQLRLPPRTFSSQTRMLIGETTKRLAIGTHVFCSCFIGNTHLRVGFDIPVRQDLMQGNNLNSINSIPRVFCRLSFFRNQFVVLVLGAIFLLHMRLYQLKQFCFI